MRISGAKYGSLWIRLRFHDRADAGDAEGLAQGRRRWRIFSEKVSGVAAKRPELERVLDELESGDVLVVTKLDRLACSTLDLLRIIDLIGKEGLWAHEIPRRSRNPHRHRRLGQREDDNRKGACPTTRMAVAGR